MDAPAMRDIAKALRFVADTISQDGDRFDYQVQRLYEIAAQIDTAASAEP